MLKKLIGVVAVTTVALVASVSMASAQAYPPPANQIRCLNDDDLVFPQGGEAVFDARTFMAGSAVTWTLFSAPVVLGTVDADAQGVSTITTNIPLDTTVGAHRVEATGVDPDGDPLTLVLNISVVAPGQAPADPLPRTGSSSTLPMAQIAVAAIVAGGFLVILTNRRRELAPVESTRR